MQRRYESFHSPTLDRSMELLIFGHFGPPMLVFPSGGGRFFDWENQGMIDAAASWLEAGKVRLVCVDSIDHQSWLNPHVDLAARVQRHREYEHYIVDEVIPFLRRETGDPALLVATTGCSLGGFHAASFALKFPELFNYALCMSGRYDLESFSGASSNGSVADHNLAAYCQRLDPAALARVRDNTHLALVCGQGAWEDKCLAETRRLADALAARGISHERDLWGYDVEHHWYWWKRQLAYYLGKTLG